MNTGGFDYSSLAFSGVASSGADRFAVLLSAGGRSGKLDLLLHLLANLPRSILLLGARGAGKTTLLRQVQAHSQDNWSVCYLAATAGLGLDRIFGELLQVLRHPAPSGGRTSLESELLEQLDLLSRNNRKLVLLLDDADLLTPGLLGAVCQFARLHPQLKLAFSLRPEDLQHKAATDALALADAHCVELAQPASATPAPQPQFVRPSHPRPPSVGPAKAFRFVLRHREGAGPRPVTWIALTALTAAAATGVVVGLLWRNESPLRPTAAGASPQPVLAPLSPVDTTRIEPTVAPGPAATSPAALLSGTPQPAVALPAVTPQPTSANAPIAPQLPAAPGAGPAGITGPATSTETPAGGAQTEGAEKPSPPPSPSPSPKPKKKKPRRTLFIPFEQPAAPPAAPQ